MPMELDKLIEKIVSAYREVQAPEPSRISLDKLHELRDKIANRYGVLLPSEYETVLQRADGILYDGVCLFGSTPLFRDEAKGWPFCDGLLEANEGFEVDGVAISNTLCFGENGFEKFCLNLKSNQFGSFGAVDGKLHTAFISFADMFRYMFAGRVTPN